METNKSEITNLPEGMSSEELDKMTTEDDTTDDKTLAQEALAATETEEVSSPAEESVEGEPTEKPAEDSSEEKEPEVDPKDAVIGGFRRDLRKSEIENAELRGELKVRKEVTTKVEGPPPKSPLEIAEAAYVEENGDLEGFSMDGKLYREQRVFDDAQAATKATTTKQEQDYNILHQAAHELQQGDLSVEKMGEGLDLTSVSKIGDRYLTEGDKVDLRDIQAKRGTKATLKEAYDIMVRRIKVAGGEDAKLLQAATDAKGKSKESQTKPKTKEKLDIDALTTEGEDEVKGEAETKTHSKILTNFIFSE